VSEAITKTEARMKYSKPVRLAPRPGVKRPRATSRRLGLRARQRAIRQAQESRLIRDVEAAAALRLRAAAARAAAEAEQNTPPTQEPPEARESASEGTKPSREAGTN
jgi:hypothetical protein